MDVFVIAGYNDLVRNHDRDMIVNTIKQFVDYVLGLANEDNVTNTVTVGSFLYPPQLAWFRDDGPEPANFVNQTNQPTEHMEYTLKNGVPVPIARELDAVNVPDWLVKEGGELRLSTATAGKGRNFKLQLRI